MVISTEDVENLKKDIREVVGAFEDGRFLRSTDQDTAMSWAIRFIAPISALARLQKFADDFDFEERP